MAALQLRRGLKANLAAAALTAAAGEPLVVTDTKELYIGTGAGSVYKISDVIFSDVAPNVEVDKIWVNTSTNTIYHANSGAWTQCSTVPIATATDLGGASASDAVVPSQKAVQSAITSAMSTVDLSTAVLKSEIATAADMGGVEASDTKVPSQKAVQSAISTAVGAVDLTGLVPKTDIATAIDLGGATPSDTKVPSQAAVKAAIGTAVSSVDLSGLVAKSEIATAVDLGGASASDTVIPSQKAVQSAITSAVSTIDLSTVVAKSDISTATDLGGVSASDVLVPSQKAVQSAISTAVGAVDLSGLVAKTDIATAVDMGGASASDTKVPSQKAVKSFVDNSVAALVIPQTWPDAVTSFATTPPASPTTGARYLVDTPATGAFTGHEGEIATYNGTTWVFEAPKTGTFIGVDSDPTGLYYYGGTGWVKKSFESSTGSAAIDVTNGVISLKTTIVAGDGSGGLVYDSVNGVLSVGVIDGGTF